jgi:hypothetical protein
MRVFKNQDLDFRLSIVLGAAATRQADVGECLAIAGRIKGRGPGLLGCAVDGRWAARAGHG